MNTFDEYQQKALVFSVYKDYMYPVLGLAEEAGEVVGKFAKAIRKGTEVSRDDVKKELGDVLWMISAIATDLGLSLEDIAEHNIDKLRDRMSRGTVVGEGDLR